jgi:hypothetical protein
MVPNVSLATRYSIMRAMEEFPESSIGEGHVEDDPFALSPGEVDWFKLLKQRGAFKGDLSTFVVATSSALPARFPSHDADMIEVTKDLARRIAANEVPLSLETEKELEDFRYVDIPVSGNGEPHVDDNDKATTGSINDNPAHADTGHDLKRG